MAKPARKFRALTFALTLIGLVQLSLVSYAQTPGDRLSRKGQLLFILGAVSKPGVYEIEGKVSLVKLIALAGGLTENHGSIAYIIRRERGGQGASPDANDDNEPGYELTQVNIEDLLKGGIDQNPYLQAGDIVNVQVADIFFVIGEVIRPGSFPWRKEMTVRQAVSLAGGLTKDAAASRGVLFRQDSVTGKRQEINFDINAVMRGKTSDIPVLPNDIFVVPSSRAKIIKRRLWLVDPPPVPVSNPCRQRRPCLS